MPLAEPNLDDRNYTDLVAEALSMLPRYAPKWTNRNPSDPGITLIELLAYFTEILLYRLNRITRENKIKFLGLLKPAEKERLANADMTEVDEALRRAVLELQQPQRAVTDKDYEHLTRTLMAESPQEQNIMRVRCLMRKNLETPDSQSRLSDRPGHISVVIVPKRELSPEVLASLVKDIRDKLEPYRLLTTRLHVVGPFYLWVSLQAVIRIRQNASAEEVQENALEKLQSYFNPFRGGGPSGEGWPFGHAIYLSEVYQLLDNVEGVDYIQDVRVLHLTTRTEMVGNEQTAIGIQIGVRSTSTVRVNSRLGCETATDTARLIRDDAGRLRAIALQPYELVRIVLRKENLVFNDSTPQERP